MERSRSLQVLCQYLSDRPEAREFCGLFQIADLTKQIAAEIRAETKRLDINFQNARNQQAFESGLKSGLEGGALGTEIFDQGATSKEAVLVAAGYTLLSSLVRYYQDEKNLSKAKKHDLQILTDRSRKRLDEIAVTEKVLRGSIRQNIETEIVRGELKGIVSRDLHAATSLNPGWFYLPDEKKVQELQAIVKCLEGSNRKNLEMENLTRERLQGLQHALQRMQELVLAELPGNIRRKLQNEPELISISTSRFEQLLSADERTQCELAFKRIAHDMKALLRTDELNALSEFAEALLRLRRRIPQHPMYDPWRAESAYWAGYAIEEISLKEVEGKPWGSVRSKSAELAVRVWELALRADPDDEQYYIRAHRACSMALMGEVKQAEEEVSEWIWQRSNDAGFASLYVRLLSLAGKNGPDAVKWLDVALSKGDSTSFPWNLRSEDFGTDPSLSQLRQVQSATIKQHQPRK